MANSTPEIALWEHAKFTGKILSLKAAAPDFVSLGFNDKASSIEVRSGVWTVCEDVNYGGRSLTLRKGRYDIDYITKNLGNDMISSVRPTEVILYKDARFSGRSWKLIDDTPDLTPMGFNDIVSSIEVTFGECTVFQHVNYQGRSLVLKMGRYDMDYLQKNLGNDVISSVRMAPRA